MLNRCVFQGRFGAEPVLKTTQNGKSVVSFSLAVERDFKGQDGERVTDWIDMVAFGQLAEHISRYYHKGSMAVVSGRLQMRPWKDIDGNKRISAEVLTDNIYFGGSKQNSSEAPRGVSAEPPKIAPAPGQFTELDDEDDMSIPF